MAAVAPPPAPLVPPLPLPASAPATVSPPPQPVALAAPPEVLARLAAGARLDAIVAGPSADGGVLLDTPAGRIVLALAPLPSAGLRFELHIQSVGPRPLAIVLNPPTTTPAGSGTLPPNVLNASGQTGQAAVVLSQGALLQATVLGAVPGPIHPAAPLTGAGGPSAPGPSLPGGATATLPQQGGQSPLNQAPGAGTPSTSPLQAIAQQTTPTAGQGTPTPPVTASPSPAATPTAPVPDATGAQTGRTPGAAHPAAGSVPQTLAGAATGANRAPWPPGAQVPMRILAVVSPAATTSPALTTVPGASMGPVIGGIVTAGHPNGAPVVAFGQGSVVLNGVAPMAVGTAVTVEIAGPVALPAHGAANPDERSSAPIWRALGEAIVALRDEATNAARPTPTPLPVPRADAQLATQIVSIMSALRSGDIKGWLGDGALRAIDRARPGLAQRVSDEFARTGRSADEPAGDWRVFTLPFMTGAAVDAIRLYLRPRRDAEAEAGDGEPGTRFVLDARLTTLGRLQLDGLIRRKARQFDLFLRTEQPLPGEQQSDIRILFAEALAITGYRGRLVFQYTPPGFVDPPATPNALEMDA